MPALELTEYNTCPVVHSQASKSEEVPFITNHMSKCVTGNYFLLRGG